LSKKRQTKPEADWFPATEPEMPRFTRYIGIDYSGAETPIASLKGLRVYLANGNASPVEVTPPVSRRKYWTRRGVAEWLVENAHTGWHRPRLFLPAALF
jgi:hypothetical protein